MHASMYYVHIRALLVLSYLILNSMYVCMYVRGPLALEWANVRAANMYQLIFKEFAKWMETSSGGAEAAVKASIRYLLYIHTYTYIYLYILRYT